LHLFFPDTLAPLLIPAPPQITWEWQFRGDNLCAWETGLRRPLRYGEIIIDPDIGRVLIGLDNNAQVDELVTPQGTGFDPRIYASFTYGAVGPVGAHPVTRVFPAAPVGTIDLRTVGAVPGGVSLQSALAGLDTVAQPVIIEINDSLVHRIDLSALPGTNIDGGTALRLAQSLTIRAAAGHRPIVLLAQALAFRPVTAAAATTKAPAVRLEGLYVAPDAAAFPPGAALITRAAVARLEVIGCTLAPGGHALRDGTRAPLAPGLRLENGYGFAAQADIKAFVPTPDIIIQRSITGSLAIDDRYRLDIEDSIVEAGLGAGDPPTGRFAIAAATNPATAWGAPLDFDGLTCFGPVRVTRVGGVGAIFTQPFEVLDNQHGCIKWSWFSGDLDRLPPNHFCVRAPEARLVFTSEWFNDPGYAQIARESDPRIRTLGPDDDAMGAFGFLLEAHKWTNLQVRLREFMPVGVRPLVVPIT
ncbi:MAG: hypothetical protein ACREWG_12310, partial [Gammaproteobacteria bacterium]